MVGSGKSRKKYFTTIITVSILQRTIYLFVLISIKKRHGLSLYVVISIENQR